MHGHHHWTRRDTSVIHPPEAKRDRTVISRRSVEGHCLRTFWSKITRKFSREYGNYPGGGVYFRSEKFLNAYESSRKAYLS